MGTYSRKPSAIAKFWSKNFVVILGYCEVKISSMKPSIVLISLLLFAMPAICQNRASAPVPEMVQRAEGGDAQSQFELGRVYEDGKDVPLDDDRAAEWFRKSAEQGNAQAQNSLGVMYALGRGVQRDKE